MSRKNLSAAFCFIFLFCATPCISAMDPLSYGYSKYFVYHPPREIIEGSSLYPNGGPLIGPGQDIPVCDTARRAAGRDNVREIHHGKDGWLFRAADFRMDFAASPLSLSYFSRLNRALAEKGQTLFIVFPPPRAMMEFGHTDITDMPPGYSAAKARAGYRFFIHQLEKAGIKTADLSGAPAEVGFYLRGDHHWSPDGAAWAAQRVADLLKKLPAYRSLPKQDFETITSQIKPPSRGSLEEFVQKNCDINIEAAAKPAQVTVIKTPGPEGLLRDNPFPLVTLLGTSNTAKDDEFNFAGALKTALRADTYEAALTGGGFGESSVRYYASDEYRQHPPKIVVWEFFPQHNYNNEEAMVAFRQMLAAIKGACGRPDALAGWTGSLRNGETDIFGDTSKIPLQNSRLYLETKNAASPGNLVLDILYADGEIDNADLTRSQREADNGRYFYSLGEKTPAPALFFHLISDKPGTRMTARLCPAAPRMAEK
jgi:alginate biosynthesis protein AlgX